jgi:spermidine synthase
MLMIRLKPLVVSEFWASHNRNILLFSLFFLSIGTGVKSNIQLYAQQSTSKSVDGFANQSQVPLFAENPENTKRLAYAYEFNKGINQCLQALDEVHCGSLTLDLLASQAQLKLSMVTGYEAYIIQKPIRLPQYQLLSNQPILQQVPALLLSLTLAEAQLTGEGQWLIESQKQAQNSINLLFQKYPSVNQCHLDNDCFELLKALLQYSNFTAESSIRSAITPYLQAMLKEGPEKKASFDHDKANAQPQHPNQALPSSLWARAIQLADLFYMDQAFGHALRFEFVSWYIEFKDGIFQDFDQNQKIPTPLAIEGFHGQKELLNLERAAAFAILKRRFSDPFDARYQAQAEFFEYCYQQHLNPLLMSYQKNKDKWIKAPQLLITGLNTLVAEWDFRQWFEKYFAYPRQRLFKADQEQGFLSTLPLEGMITQGMFSKLKVRAEGFERTMYFVRPNGDELIETRIDFQRKDFLKIAYTRDMLANYLFEPQPQKALLIGLGGGSMVYALHEYQPQLKLDIVEIDPMVMKSALADFGLQRFKGDEYHRFFTMDGFDFFKTMAKDHEYDVIYLDAFLQPTEETDSTGNPLKLKTLGFLKEIQRHLSDRGLFVINLNEHEGLESDIATIRAAFVESYLWEVPHSGNYIAVGLKKPFMGSFKENLKKIDELIKPSFSFTRLLKRAYATQKK